MVGMRQGLIDDACITHFTWISLQDSRYVSSTCAFWLKPVSISHFQDHSNF